LKTTVDQVKVKTPMGYLSVGLNDWLRLRSQSIVYEQSTPITGFKAHFRLDFSCIQKMRPDGWNGLL